jgi:hypothetical protein
VKCQQNLWFQNYDSNNVSDDCFHVLHSVFSVVTESKVLFWSFLKSQLCTSNNKEIPFVVIVVVVLGFELYSSWVARMTGVYHHVCLVSWDVVSLSPDNGQILAKIQILNSDSSWLLNFQIWLNLCSVVSRIMPLF